MKFLENNHKITNSKNQVSMLIIDVNHYSRSIEADNEGKTYNVLNDLIL